MTEFSERPKNNQTGLWQSYFAVFGIAAILYIISCAPGALWQDSGMIQYRVWHNDIEGGLGLALSHPLFYILAIAVKYIPLGEFMHKVNLVSSIAAAVTVANLFLLVRLWCGKNFPAILSAVTLLLSHTFWRHVSITETYTLYTAILTAELVVLLQYCKTKKIGYLYLLGFLNGLSIAGHMLGSIPFLCYVIFVIVLLFKRGICLKNAAVIIFLWVLGALPYEYLIVSRILKTGDIIGTFNSALFGRGWRNEVINLTLSAKIVKENIMWILLNFPTPNIMLFFLGIGVIYKVSPLQGFASIILALLLLFFVFAFRYTILDRYAFFIPFYCLMSALIGAGAYKIVSKGSRRVFSWAILLLALLPIPAYIAAPALAKEVGLKSGRKREVPYRDDYEYFLRPWRTGYRGAEKFAQQALDSVEKNAIIYADGTTVYPLFFAQQIKGKRKDVSIVSWHGSSSNISAYSTAEEWDGRAVYVVSPVRGYCPQFVLEQYDFVKAGVLYKVISKNEKEST